MGNNDKEKNHAAGEGLFQGEEITDSKLRKAIKVFIAEDFDSVKDSIYDDYIKPRSNAFMIDMIRKVKEFVFDTCSGLLQSFIFGKSKSDKKDGSYNGQKVNYVNYYYNDSHYDNRYEYIEDHEPGSVLKKILIPSYGKAEELKNTLEMYMKRSPKVYVADYYLLTKTHPETTDYNYGWTKFDSITIEPFRRGRKKGYVLNIQPKPYPID